MSKRVSKETAEKLFELYYAMGDNRSLAKLQEYVLEHWGKKETPSLITLKRLSTKNNWQLRIEQRDVEVAKGIKERSTDAIIDTKAQYRKILKALIAEAVKSIKLLQRGKIPVEIRNVKDLERVSNVIKQMIELDLEIVGERGDNVVVNISSELLPRNENNKPTR